MKEIVEKDEKTRREVWEREKAISHFKKIGEKYKAEIIESIPTNEELSVYHHGDTWHDLCRGPHLASSGKIGKGDVDFKKTLDFIIKKCPNASYSVELGALQRRCHLKKKNYTYKIIY